jgi:hypothetical protein
LHTWVGDSYGNLFCIDFDGISFTNFVPSINTGIGYILSIGGDGNFIYVASNGQTLQAYDIYNGALRLRGSIYPTGQIFKIACGSDGYIYVGTNVANVDAYTFDGTNFHLRGRFSVYNTPCGLVWDGSLLHYADYVLIRALHFDGANFHIIAEDSSTGGYRAMTWDGVRFWGVGYSSYTTLTTLTFNGSAYTVENSKNILAGSSFSIASDGQFIYVPEANNRIGIYYISASVITLKAIITDNLITQSTNNQIAFGGGYGYYVTVNSDNQLKSIQMQLIAQFNADHIVGAAPLTVNFTAI